MSNRSDILAGRAFVELYLRRDQFLDGLEAAKESLSGFGDSLTSIGTQLTAAGAAIVAPFQAARFAQGLFSEDNTMIADLMKQFMVGGARSVQALTNAVKDLGQAMASVVSPTNDQRQAVTGIAHAVANAVHQIAGLIRNNQETIRTVLTVAKAALVAGGVFIGFGKAIAVLTVAAGFVKTALFALTTPLGTIAALLAAGVAFWVRYTKAGQAAAQGVKEAFDLSFGGIRDALAGGDLVLAAKIAWAGIVMGFHEATVEMQRLWANIKWWVLTTWNEATTGIAKAMFTIIGQLETAWVNSIAFLKTVWNELTTFIRNSQQVLGESIGNMIIEDARKTGLVSKEFADAWKDTLKNQTKANTDDITAASNKARGETDKTRDDRLKQIADRNKTAGDILDADRKRQADAIDAEFDKSIADKRKALDDARNKLRDLREQAGKIKPLAPDDDAKPAAGFGKGDVVGTFFAAALSGLAGKGISAEQKLLDEAKAQKDLAKKQLEVQKDLLDAQKALRWRFVG